MYKIKGAGKMKIISKLASRNQTGAGLKINDIFAETAQTDNISFGMGLPDNAAFPSEALEEAFHQAVINEGIGVFQYHGTQGPQVLREKITQLADRYYGIDIAADDVILTQGGQQAIDMVGRAFLNQHDDIIVEGPTYVGALEALDGYEPNYHEVPLQADGMDMEQLELTLQKYPATKFVYTIPDFQNPTGITMSLGKRQRLLALAEQYDFYIIEDSPYRYLRYSGDMLPSLAALDQNGRVILISSFSKILAPALRTGWLTASPELIAQFLEIKAALDLQPPHLNLMAIDSFLANNDLAAHIDKLSAIYRTKRDLMVTILEKNLPESVSFTRPDGGFFIWVTLPESIDATKLLLGPMLKEAKIIYVPSEMQYASRQVKNHFRLNFTNPSSTDIEVGITRLAQFLQKIC